MIFIEKRNKKIEQTVPVSYPYYTCQNWPPQIIRAYNISKKLPSQVKATTQKKQDGRHATEMNNGTHTTCFSFNIPFSNNSTHGNISSEKNFNMRKLNLNYIIIYE